MARARDSLQPLLPLLLMLLLLPLMSEAGSELRPVPEHQCLCNFAELSAKLTELYRPDRSSVEMALGFAQTLAFLNINLMSHFTELRRCARFWLESTRTCDPSCSCEADTVCCRNTALRSLETSVQILKDHVKMSFTPYSSVAFVQEYHSNSMRVQGTFASTFKDFIAAMKKGHDEARSEMKHYKAFFDFMQRGRPLQAIFAETAPPGNASLSIISRMARHYSCDPNRVLPFYLNVYGTVLQYVLMRELNEELQLNRGPEPSSFDKQPQWQQYLHLTSAMTTSIVDCSKEKIFAIRSQEIRDKDVEMRNAALVFSSFLLVLVIIIALIVVFACRTGRRRQSVVVIDQPAPVSEDPESREPLYKRHYEMDDAV